MQPKLRAINFIVVPKLLDNDHLFQPDYQRSAFKTSIFIITYTIIITRPIKTTIYKLLCRVLETSRIRYKLSLRNNDHRSQPEAFVVWSRLREPYRWRNKRMKNHEQRQPLLTGRTLPLLVLVRFNWFTCFGGITISGCQTLFLDNLYNSPYRREKGALPRSQS